MSFLFTIKEAANKENITAFAGKAKELAMQVKNKATEATVVVSATTEQEEEETGSKMLKVMDWAFDKANGNMPGFGTSHEMAEKYLQKYGSVNAAIDHLVNWQITSAATAGFVTSLGGLATMPITLPANIAGVMAIQLRMIGAIAELGGFHENTEEKKTGMYLCLLGSQAGNVLSKTAGQFAVKFATASLKKLPGTILTKINQAVGFRLVTKFGEKGLVNINRAIPILGGIVGGSVDALSTYAIAKAAKALFLNEIIDFEKQEQIEINKVRLMINMALVDGIYSPEEAEVLKVILGGLNISPKAQSILLGEIDCPKQQKVDLSPFKDDMMYSATLLAGLYRLVMADGTIHPAENIYMRSIAHELGYTEEMLKQIV
ncbi:MAG: TerB family tellurite resistance protein [Paludibacteraceae bacterium]